MIDTTPTLINNPIPAVIIAVDSEALAKVAMIEAEAEQFATLTTMEQTEAADALVKRAIEMDKAIEKAHRAVKAPVLEVGRQIDDVASNARAGLLSIKKDLGLRVARFIAEENERRARLRREQEERERQAAEAARKAAEEAQRQRDAEEAAARAAREAANEEDPDSLPPAAALASDDDQPPVEAARAADVRPVIVLPPQPMSVTADERQAARPVKSAAVKVTFKPKAEITDPEALYKHLLANGGVLYGLTLLAPIDKKVKELAEKGLAFPGVTVSQINIVGAK